jgi:hypothetical protein
MIGCGASISIGMGRKYKPTMPIHQNVIDCPGIHTHGGEGGKVTDCLQEARLHFFPEVRKVPVCMPRQRAESVGESMDLMQGQMVPSPSSDDDTTAGGTEIHGGAINPW